MIPHLEWMDTGDVGRADLFFIVGGTETLIRAENALQNDTITKNVWDKTSGARFKMVDYLAH
jgi:hypothetical protein